MKQVINIRSDHQKPKVGNYQALREDINKRKLNRDEQKKSVTSSTDPSKISTTKALEDQR